MSAISRLKAPVSFTATNSEATTPVVAFDGVLAMLLLTQAATLTFYGSNVNTGTFVALMRRTSADTDWTAFEAVTMAPAAAGWFPMPDECAGFQYLKIVSSNATEALVIQPST